MPELSTSSINVFSLRKSMETPRIGATPLRRQDGYNQRSTFGHGYFDQRSPGAPELRGFFSLWGLNLPGPLQCLYFATFSGNCLPLNDDIRMHRSRKVIQIIAIKSAADASRRDCPWEP
jgi:hypothetical protein